MKRLAALILGIVMLFGCASAEVATNQPTTAPVANSEVVTLKVFAPQNGEYSWADNLQTKELEEKLGIKIEWVVAPSGTVREKLNLLLAGGQEEMVDLILVGVGDRLDRVTEAQLGAQGLLMPLNQYFDTISEGYKAAFEAMPGLRDSITTPDGNIYSMPNVDGSLHMQYSMKMWINTEWLENLNLEMPTTTEELYQVLKAFKEKDANGNGDPNDEIPLSTIKDITNAAIDSFLMQPFQLTPEGEKLYVDNGKVTFSPVQEGYREGLRYLNKLYAEGLINPESFTQDMANQVNVNENGEEAVIGCFLGQRPGFACDLTTMPNSEKWEQYQPVAPLTGPSGQAIAAWNPYAMYQTGMAFIPTGAKNPEVAFRLVDYLATLEGSMRSNYGVEGVHWRKATEGELGLDGTPATVTLLPAATEDVNYSWTQLAGLVRNTEFTVGQTTNPDPYADDVRPLDGRQILLYKGSLSHEAVRQPLDSVMPSLFFTEDVAEDISLKKTTIMDYTDEAIVRFITGDMSIENDWDSYVQTLNDIGLEDYLKLYQDEYDASAFAKK